EIEEQNERMIRQQHDFRRAADIVTDALMTFDEVEAVAAIGSVAKPLWKEVPRFREFRRARIEVWHECKDVDRAVGGLGGGWSRSVDRACPVAQRRYFGRPAAVLSFVAHCRAVRAGP